MALNYGMTYKRKGNGYLLLGHLGQVYLTGLPQKEQLTRDRCPQQLAEIQLDFFYLNEYWHRVLAHLAEY